MPEENHTAKFLELVQINNETESYLSDDCKACALEMVYTGSVIVHVECRGFESHSRQLIFFLGKVTALGVLCCFALLTLFV